MTTHLAEHLVQKLTELGDAIDINRQFQVFDDGIVGLVTDQSEVEKTDEREGTGGPAAGSREGSPGPRRSPSEARPRLGLLGEQMVRLAGLEGLWSAYPTQVIEGDRGLWIIVKSSPLGHDGPQVTFVIAYPAAEHIDPKAWAFWKLGEFPKSIGPRHTNFPDASICAFGPGDWDRSEGLVTLVDFYSTWVVRQLFYQQFGRWPGNQHGSTALYRRTEFSPDEWCGCGSGKRYGDCHEAEDKGLSEKEAADDHRRTVGSDYCVRKPPKSVLRFVRSRFKKVPAFRDAYENR